MAKSKKEKRSLKKTPGIAYSKRDPRDDIHFVPSTYYDAVFLFIKAEIYLEKYNNQKGPDISHFFDIYIRYARLALSSIFTFSEAFSNGAAFGHVNFHRKNLPQPEVDILENMETILDHQGNILRKVKHYPIESRFLFLVRFLTGKEFDTSSKLWQDFKKAKELRDYWTHPKPPFDTSSLTLTNVKNAIITIRAVHVEVSSMIGIEPPPWLGTFEDVYNYQKSLIDKKL